MRVVTMRVPCVYLVYNNTTRPFISCAKIHREAQDSTRTTAEQNGYWIAPIDLLLLPPVRPFSIRSPVFVCRFITSSDVWSLISPLRIIVFFCSPNASMCSLLLKTNATFVCCIGVTVAPSPTRGCCSQGRQAAAPAVVAYMRYT